MPVTDPQPAVHQVFSSSRLSPPLTRLVVGALVVIAVARFVPLGAAPYVIAAAGVVALWPLAYELWKRPKARPAGPQLLSMLAT
jgi:hypothetical protein